MSLMKIGTRTLIALSLCLSAASFATLAQDVPAVVGKHQNDPAEKAAIARVLSTYTTAVSHGDEAAFESILLNDQIPFSSTNELRLAKADPASVQMNHFARFKKAIFESGERFDQHFYNVRIEQDGDLAQVSLDFVTRDAVTKAGGYGWKSVTLLKVAGQWKIASELYTVYALPK
jgi:hypothetical protein